MYQTFTLKLTLLLLFSTLFSAYAETSKNEDVDYFHALVTSPSGNIVSGANVYFSPQTSPLNRKVFQSNKQGLVKVKSDDFGGEAYWAAKHIDYSNVGGAHLKLKEYPKQTPFKIVYKEGPSLSGNVLGPLDKPLAGVEVRVDRAVPAGGHTHNYQSFDTTTTDENGDFLFPNLYEGKLSLNAKKGSLITQGSKSIKHPSTDDISLKLWPSSEVHLSVLNPNLEEKDNLSISWYATKKEVKKYNSKSQKIRGSLKSGNTQPTSWSIPQKHLVHIKVSHADIISGTFLNNDISSHGNLNFEIDFKPLVEGTIKSEKDESNITDVKIDLELQSKRYFSGKTSSAKSDDKGAYKITATKEGVANITFSAQGWKPKTVTDVNLKLNESSKLDVKLTKGSSITHRFWDNSREEPLLLSNNKLHYFIVNSDTKSENRKYNSKTNEKGEFLLTGWSEGEKVIYKLNGYSSKEILLQPTEETVDIYLVPTGQLRLHIVDENKKKIQTAKFRTRNLNDESFTEKESWSKAKYNKDQQTYLITDLSPKTYTFKVSAKGYYDTEYQSITINNSEETELTITLKKSENIKIEISNDEEDYKDSLSISLYKPDGNYSSHERASRNKKTNLYEFELNDSNAVRMSISMEGYVQRKNVSILSEVDDDYIYKIKLEKGITFSGMIVDQNGQTIQKAQVSVNANSNHKSSQSNSDGTFKVEGIIPGSAKISVSKDGYMKYEKSEELTDSRSDYRIELKTGGEISGQVFNEELEPQANIKVKILISNSYGFQDYYDLGNNREIKTNERGEFSFVGLKKSKYRIQTNSTIGIGESEIIDLGEEEIREGVNITLKEGLEISGIIIDEEGNPTPNLKLRSYSIMNGSNTKRTQSDKDGKFIFKNLTKGNHSIQLESKDYELKNNGLYGQTMYEAGKKDITLEVTKSKLIRFILKTDEEKVIEAYTVGVRKGNSSYEQKLKEAIIKGNTFTILSSEVNTRNPMDGSFTVVVHAKGYNPGELKLNSLKDALKQENIIELKPETSVKFLIVDHYSSPLSNVEVKHRIFVNNQYSNYFGGSNKVAYSDEEGYVTINGMNEGMYDFQLKKGGYAESLVTSEVDHDNPEIKTLKMGKGGTVKGRVLDASGTGLANYHVFLKTNQSNNFSKKKEVLTNDQGEFIMTHVPAGLYRINYSKAKSQVNFMNNNDLPVVEVEEESTVTIDLGGQSEAGLGTIKGIIKGESKFIIAMLMNASFGMPQKQTQFQGNEFEIPQVKPGQYTLMISGVSGEVMKQNIEVIADQTLEVVFEMSNMTIIGKIVDAEGKTLPMLQAILAKPNANMTDQLSAMNAFEAFAMVRNGDLKLNVNTPGTYTLTLSAMAGMTPGVTGFKTIDVTISENETLDLGTIVMDSGEDFRGNITDATGLPIENANFIITKNNFPSMNNSWKSTETGAFLLKGVPEYPFQLNITANGFIPKTLTVESNDLTVSLDLESTIKVILNGKWINNRKLSLVNLDEPDTLNQATIFNTYRFAQNKTDRVGQYTFKGLTSGSYQIKVEPLTKDDSELLSDSIYLNTEHHEEIQINLLDE